MRLGGLRVLILFGILVVSSLIICTVVSGNPDVDWHIQDHVLFEDTLMILDRNITVDGGGWLELRSTTLIFNNSIPGEHVLKVLDGGQISTSVSDSGKLCEIRPMNSSNPTQLFSYWASRIELRDLRMIDCGFFTEGTPNVFRAAIEIANSDNVYIQKLTMVGRYRSVKISGCNGVVIRDCVFDNSTVRPIIIESTYNATITGNFILTAFGLDIGGSTGIVIEGNRIVSSFNGMSVYLSDNVLIRNNDFTVVGMWGCIVDMSKIVTIEKNMFRGISSLPMTLNGVQMKSASFITISSNHFVNFSKGIEIYNPMVFSKPYNYLVDNSFSNCSIGIYIASGNNTLLNNTIEESIVGILITDGASEGWSDVLSSGNLIRRCWLKSNAIGIQCMNSMNTTLSFNRFQGNVWDINASSSDAFVEMNGTHMMWYQWAINLEGGDYSAISCDFISGSIVINARSAASANISQSRISQVGTTIVARGNCAVSLYNTTHPRQYDIDSSSVLKVYWDVDVSIHPESNPAVYLAGYIVIRDSYSRVVNETSLLIAGRIQRFVILEFELQDDSIDNRTPHRFQAMAKERNAIISEDITMYRRIAISIDNLPPVFRNVTPAEEELNITSVTFSGMAFDNSSGSVQIGFYLNGEIFWQGLDNWSLIIELKDGHHEIKIVANDVQNNSATLMMEITIDTEPPWLIIYNPSTQNSTTKEDSLMIIGQVGDAVCLTVNGERKSWEYNNFNFTMPLSRDGLYPFVITASDWIGNKATITLNVTKDTVPPILLLGEYPTLTRERNLIINGSTENEDVNILLDGSSIEVMPTGDFSIQLVLIEGLNAHELFAIDISGNFAITYFSIVLDTIANISVQSPLNGTKFEVQDIEILLQVEPGVKVRIVGEKWYIADALGYVRIKVTLLKYETTFSFETVDLAGNEGHSEISVLYSPYVQAEDKVEYLYIIPIVIVLIIIGVAAMTKKWRDSPR